MELSRDCTTGPAHDAGILAEARDAYRWKVTAPTKVVVGRTASRSSTRGQGAGRVVAAGRYRTLDGQDHSAFWTAPDAVAGTLTELLKR